MNNKLTTSQAIAGYNLNAQARRLSPHTLEDYNRTFNKLLKFTNDPPISKLTPPILRNFLIAQPVSAKTLLNIHVAISALFTWLIQENLVQENPMRQVARPKPEKRTISPFTETDLKLLISSLNKSRSYTCKSKTVQNARPTAIRDRAIVLLLLDTGLRATELCTARILDLDLKNRRLKVFGKGSKERILPFSPRTGQALWRYLTTRPDDPLDRPLFLTQQSLPMTRDRLLKLLNHLGDRAGVPNCHPHRFRHTFAILYLRNGGDPFTLQLILGHSDISTVKRYLTIAQSDLDAQHRLNSPVDRLQL
jgi:integrase/recombinase XerD